MDEIKTLDEFIRKHDKIEKPGKHLLFYRGHGEPIEEILPILFRKPSRKKEEHLFFKNAIKEHPNLFCDDKTTLEKLVRMQHYGIPTRLLDITQNPLVALYFACCDKDNKKDGEVVVFSKMSRQIKFYDSDAVSILSNLCKLAGKSKDFDTKLKTKDFNNQNNIGKLLHAIKEEKPYFVNIIDPKDMKSCFFVYAKKNNDRIKAQNGLFIIYGIDSDINKDIFNRLVIDKDSKKEILKQLEKINITNQTLFPELESTANYLKNKYGGKG
ncbi:MAG: FRG domain-containing protein [Bacteroidales bacterium]|jgi:hypothetical protein|nr:FRG domain-containing protein [Bacteroidales bacterium]